MKTQNFNTSDFGGIVRCSDDMVQSYINRKLKYALSLGDCYKNNLGSLPCYEDLVKCYYRVSEGTKLSNRQRRRLREYSLHAFDSTQILPSDNTILDMVDCYGSVAKLALYSAHFNSITSEDLLSDGYVTVLNPTTLLIWEDHMGSAPDLASYSMADKILRK
jgi:hypothetical protein